VDALAKHCDPHSLSDLYVRVAKINAGCARLAKNEAGQSDTQRARLFDEYSNSAINMLRAAINAGFTELQSLSESDEMSSLRDHPDFIALLSQ
jgi:hypothetical protein